MALVCGGIGFRFVYEAIGMIESQQEAWSEELPAETLRNEWKFRGNSRNSPAILHQLPWAKLNWNFQTKPS
jgi:hypothetical protein